MKYDTLINASENMLDYDDYLYQILKGRLITKL